MVTMTVSSLLMGPLVLVPMMVNTMVESSIEEKRVINNQREDTKEEPGDLSYIQTFCFQQVTFTIHRFQTSQILLDSFPSNLLTDDVGTVFTQMSLSVWDVLAIEYHPVYSTEGLSLNALTPSLPPLPEFSFKSKSWKSWDGF